MTISEEAVRRREVGAHGPQRGMGQAVLDLACEGATMQYEQQAAENLGEYFCQADTQNFTVE
ncbi:hypothetical protein FACS1894168_0040 [Deltaproteobacteria bacterium]|nr:hypothetical protein FACS1894168_0040 [Deltaproteobacteria bacterium]